MSAELSVRLLAAFTAAYLLGAVPTSYLAGRLLRGIDLRRHGSGNLGATNVFRTLGVTPAMAVLTLDILKGFCASFWLPGWFGLEGSLVAPGMILGFPAIAGHVFSPFVRFRGGKGVATSAGAFLGLAPMPMLIAGAVFLVIVGITRMVSLGSITAAAVAAVSVFFFPVSGPVRIVAVLVAALIILRHHSNIKRILKREEPRL